MATKRASKSGAASAISSRDSKNSKPLVPIPAVELLSFLRQTRGVQTWTDKDLAKALKIALPEAKEGIAALELQGYIEPVSHSGRWKMTEQGELVSGAKPARFTRQSVERALDALRDRIKAANQDKNADYKITDAVAFGDFLGDAARVQAAQVGIRLTPKKDEQVTASAASHRAELAFLKQLRGKTALLHLDPYEDWMRSRSHRDLL